MSSVHLIIEGMTCGHCTSAVERALKAVAGVEQVSVTLEPGEATVTGSANPDTLIEAVVEEGYQARVG
jgi:copper chaperone CopZ